MYGLHRNLIGQLLHRLDDFFQLWRDMFDFLPLPVKVLIFFAFGGVLLLCLLRMLVNRG